MAEWKGYNRRSVESHMKKKHASTSMYASLFTGIPEFKTKAGSGKHKVRVLPPCWEGAESMFYEILVRYGIGPDNEAYLDLGQFGKEDPTSKYIEREIKAGRGRGSHVRQWKGKRRNVALVIVAGRESEGVMIYNFAPGLYDEIMDKMVDEDSNEIIWIDDPDEGRWITFDCNKTTTDDGRTIPKYENVKLANSNSPVFKDKRAMERLKQWMANNPLPTFLNVYDASEIDTKLQGTIIPGVSMSEAEPKPQNTKVSSQKDEDEDDDPISDPSISLDGDVDDDALPTRDRQKISEDEFVDTPF